jgi:hypothetical protein
MRNHARSKRALSRNTAGGVDRRGAKGETLGGGFKTKIEPEGARDERARALGVLDLLVEPASLRRDL